jgi:hypothetical protein
MGNPEIDIKPYLDYVTAMVRKFMPEVFDCIELEEEVGPANVQRPENRPPNQENRAGIADFKRMN